MPIWLNGRVQEEASAQVSILDRGFLFGDGVYEVIRVFNGVGLQMRDHARRLARSLRESGIEGFDAADIPTICAALLEANGLRDASIYIQVTRGAAATRAHLPAPGLTPTVVAMATPLPSLLEFRQPECVRAVLLEDLRWLRCDIKSIALMGNVLAVMEAARRGADEAIFHRSGAVAEGASTNVFALLDGALITPPLTTEPPILHGVTRLLALAASEQLGLEVTQRPIPVEALRRAEELMVTSSRRIVAPVTHLDGTPVGAGGPGPVSLALFEAARHCIARECGVALPAAAARAEQLLGGSSRR
jgi:D-alanine transaminase